MLMPRQKLPKSGAFCKFATVDLARFCGAACAAHARHAQERRGAVECNRRGVEQRRVGFEGVWIGRQMIFRNVFQDRLAIKWFSCSESRHIAS